MAFGIIGEILPMAWVFDSLFLYNTLINREIKNLARHLQYD